MSSQRIILLTDCAPISVDESNVERVCSVQSTYNKGQSYETEVELYVERHKKGVFIVWGKKDYSQSSTLGKHNAGFLATKENLISKMKTLGSHLEVERSTIDFFVQSLPAENFELDEEIADNDCLVIDFDGSLRIDPKKLFFVKVDNNPNTTRISGTDWLKLSENQREEFTIEDLGQALHDSNKHSYERIKVIVLKEILTKGK